MVKVTKSDGTFEEFDRIKLENSLLKARIGSLIVIQIVELLSAAITDGMRTAEIRRRLLEELRRLDLSAASQYESSAPGVR